MTVNHFLMPSVLGVGGESLLGSGWGNLSASPTAFTLRCQICTSPCAFAMAAPKGTAETVRRSSCMEQSPARVKSRKLMPK